MSPGLMAPDRTQWDNGGRAYHAMPDTELLRLMRSGVEDAFGQFVRRHSGRMLMVARRLLRCEHDAADAVLEAFASAFAALDSFEGSSRVSTWLHRIVVNSCLMKLRAEKRRPALSIDTLFPPLDGHGGLSSPVRSRDPDACDRLCVEETRQQVRAGIDALPDSYRTVLLLRDIEGYDTEETARLLMCSTSNVKTRLHRARQALRTRLDPLFSEEFEREGARAKNAAA